MCSSVRDNGDPHKRPREEKSGTEESEFKDSKADFTQRDRGVCAPETMSACDSVRSFHCDRVLV